MCQKSNSTRLFGCAILQLKERRSHLVLTVRFPGWSSYHVRVLYFAERHDPVETHVHILNLLYPNIPPATSGRLGLATSIHDISSSLSLLLSTNTLQIFRRFPVEVLLCGLSLDRSTRGQDTYSRAVRTSFYQKTSRFCVSRFHGKMQRRIAWHFHGLVTRLWGAYRARELY